MEIVIPKCTDDSMASFLEEIGEFAPLERDEVVLLIDRVAQGDVPERIRG